MYKLNKISFFHREWFKMERLWRTSLIIFLSIFFVAIVGGAGALGASKEAGAKTFPRSLDSYGDADVESIPTILKNRVKQEPFNLFATLIFLCAIIHAFLTSKFIEIAHKWERRHEQKIKEGLAEKYSIHHGARLFHFLGEVEVVFGLWVIALTWAIFIFYDRKTWIDYISYHVNFTEAMFVVTVMTLAATRPILKLSEAIMQRIASLLGGTLSAWWFTILTIGPMLGSLITEPAAMTISALLLAHKLYELEPSEKFKYATIGLLFVNISVGGTLTHFAAPPVLMVAGPWDWGMGHMLAHFGWKAVIGMVISNGLYFFLFRSELTRLEKKHQLRSLKDEIQHTFMRRTDMKVEWEKIGPAVNQKVGLLSTFEQQIDKFIEEIKGRLETQYLPRILKKGHDPSLVKEAFDQRFEEIKLLKLQEFIPGLLPVEKRPPFIDPKWESRDDLVPGWVTLVHVLFLTWIIVVAHHPQLFISALLLFLGFSVITSPYQNLIDLRQPILVGFFLGGLVIHGGVQGWWIEPVLGHMKEIPLMFCATILTAFNDNAAITYLSTLVPGFTDSLKYSVVAGAVAGGGLTVIANAPNPAGQSILKKYFSEGVSPIQILKAAMIPTLIVWLCFLIFR